ncbi:hypothetical protein FDC06_00220 [Clostridium botulinum]|uniref:Uncharacterized protein n=1 Tax=Clostridium botulinum (strain Hall / ATCC 3502 / NCTC 13319 / Type A) TaxID=441771 RepID=A5I3I8_CLOBH|nr:hypothetical protein DB732_10740 [Clostridium botulinum]CAL83606.1 conserved hypothetical protein [Clostridium botulinum A str. ATCC 3502]AWB30713.1 hypothetical protein DBN47_10710 [Clostridium botulinum]EGT5614422.1 hypothetical protein [Clostridium botulinum]EGT5622475.1 hypothetical protein [Clostridium botulinum]
MIKYCEPYYNFSNQKTASVDTTVVFWKNSRGHEQIDYIAYLI